MKCMKWSVALLVAAVLPAAVAAQSGTMAKGDKMDKMEMKDAAYTGCIEAGGTTGTFLLTQLAADHWGKDTMKKDASAFRQVVEDGRGVLFVGGRPAECPLWFAHGR
jgi:hypothetical protein